MSTTFETYYGMLSAEDYVSTAHPRFTWRPETWDQSLLLMDPGGNASLTAMMSLTNKVQENSPRFHWGEQTMPDDYGTISDVWFDSNMASAGDAYSPTSAGPTTALTATHGAAYTGATLYFQMAAAQASKFVKGMVVATRDTSNPENTVRGYVSVAPTINGASSYVTVVLLETDDNSGTFTLAADACDGLKIIGNVNAEGADAPDPVGYMHQDKEGCCQIFRTSMKHSRTAKQTKLRTPNQVRKARRELNLMHQARKERSLFHGIRNADYTVGGEPARLAGGLDYYITSNVYNLSSAMTKANIDTMCEAMAAKKPQGMSSNRRLCLMGQGAYVHFTSLVYGMTSLTRWQLTPMGSVFGFEIMSWKHPLITLDLMVHPLLTQDPAMTNSMYCVLPSLLETHEFQKDVYRPDVRSSNGMDGEMSELLCEVGWAVKGEEMMAIMHNIT